MANRQLEQASVNSARQYTGDELAAMQDHLTACAAPCTYWRTRPRSRHI
jgi:hypothetical protein